MSIYYAILGQIIRFLLRAAAVYLGYFGVTSEQQSEFVEVTVGYVVPILILALVELWSYLKNRYFPVLLETALQARPTENIDAVKAQAAEKSATPVIY